MSKLTQFGTYSSDEVFAAMDSMPRQRRAVLPDGRSFKRTSQRLVLFRQNHICVDCGIEGTVFVLESAHKDITPHMNLYAVDADGKMILMTKDHILPRSKGGKDLMDNYQTMCQPCNAYKGNVLEEERKVRMVA